MLLASVPPSEACRPPAPKGSSDSEFEKKNRAETLSCAPRNSRSQFVVNWSSVYLPDRLTVKSPVPVPSSRTLGIRNPLGSPNWLLLNWSSFRINRRRCVVEEGLRNGLLRAVRWNRWNARADECPRRNAAALPRPLIIQEEKAPLLRANWSPQASAKNVLLHRRSRLVGAIQEELLRVQTLVRADLIR